MTTTPVLPNLYLRTVNIRSEFLGKIHAFDTNIVLQSPTLAEKDRYDLIIGTNIFVYYGPFEQGLAMINLEKMLKDGGMLLSNNALVEFPFTPIHNVGYSKTIYSEQKNDGDAIVWYQKKK
jgi:chemotaxis methyl-accepting protein methylase